MTLAAGAAPTLATEGRRGNRCADVVLAEPGRPVAVLKKNPAGEAVDCSATTPKPTEWWLRPVSSAARVGEQSAVEWKFVKRRPLVATQSRAGVGITPTKVDGAAKPTSSVMIKRMFGASLGGVAGQ